MKKITLLTGLLLLTIFVSPAFAAYLGSPIILGDKEQWSFSVEGNFISEKDLEVSGATVESESNQFGVKSNYDFGNGFNAFLKLGMADWELKDPTAGAKTDVSYDTEPYFGFGMRYLQEMPSDVIFAVDLQYIFQNGVDIDSVIFEGESGYNIKGADADVTEFQLSLLLGREFKTDKITIVPYAGPYYQKFDFEIGNFYFETNTWMVWSNVKNKLEGDDEIGAILGVTFVLSETMDLNIESRFAAEQAISLGASYKF